MTCVTIDIANLKVAFHADADKARAVADKQDLLLVTKADDLGELSGSQMVAMYNATVDQLLKVYPGLGLQHTSRFANKEAGIKRLMANITDLWESARAEAKEKPARAAAAKPAKEKSDKAASAPRRATGINLAPQNKVYPCRAGTKQAAMVDILSRERGATMEELMTELAGGKKPWKEVTVKSGLNWDMNKLKGYGIRTTKRGDADCYHLTYPKGMEAPLPHTPRKSVKG